MYAVPTDTFDLTVMYVGEGGNTDDGKYFYKFSPEILLTHKAGNINIVLTPKSTKGIRIFTVVDNGGGEMGLPEVAPDGRSATVYDSVSRPALINVAVVVTDGESEPGERKYIVCDPQVINVPD
ncbi:hypothetical protein [Stenotrophomonas sp. PS02289]|uniref:hypothetical protein n=1 Tax=Stenotrophomonas sp. PS02289 TaxID=2991422 RepID=UPI00249B5A87|nr:hypothetical protein [Stenotrophomonas sp. PS02289]